jgi:hypothetical protein
MFYWKKDKQDLVDTIKYFAEQVDVLRQRVEKLEAAPHGLKKDGTPRAKPGRKVGS